MKKTKQNDLTVILDSLESFIYIVDYETCQIIYGNQKFMSVFGNDVLEKNCCEIIQCKQNNYCFFCPKKEKSSDNYKETIYHWQQYHPVLKRWHYYIDKLIIWNHKKAILKIGMDITEFKEKEELLFERERRYRGIFEHSEDAIFLVKVEKDGQFVYEETNPSHQKKTGIPLSMLQGKSPQELLPKEIAESVSNNYRRCLEAKKSIAYEEELVLPGGKKTWWTQLVPIPNHLGEIDLIAGISLDITERKKQEEETNRRDMLLYAVANTVKILLHHRDFYEALQESIRILGRATKTHQIVVFENKKSHNQWAIELKASWSKNTKKNFKEYKVWDNAFLPHWILQMEKKEIVIESSIYLSELYEEKEEDAQILFLPIFLEEEFWGFVVFETKEKEWTSAEMAILSSFGSSIASALERSRAEKAILQAKEETEKAYRVKSDFLANISHEIRTPINAILGFAEILKKNLSHKQEREYVESILLSGKNLLDLINDILDLSKIEANAMRIEPHPNNIKLLCQEIYQIFSLKIKEKGIDFQIDIDKDIPDYLLFDEVRVRQILLNIVGNAIKFTHTGKVVLRLQKENSKENSFDLIIEVEDTGIGIAEGDLPLIFEPFRQRENHNTRKYGGTGLGLAITKRLTEMMQGKISVQSVLGKGSVFKVFLPSIQIASAYVVNEKENKNTPTLSIEDTPSFSLSEEDKNFLRKNLSLQNIDWEKGLDLGEVSHFALQLKTLADTKKIHFLVDYAEKLYDYVEHLRIDKIQESIKIIKKILS